MARPTLILLAMMLALAACDRESVTPEGPVPVTVDRVAPDGGTAPVSYAGNVQPETQVDLQFQVSGTVDEVAQRPGPDGGFRNLQGGDAVAQGEALASLDDSAYRSALQQAEGQLASAQAGVTKTAADYRRSRDLAAKDYLSQSDLDSSREAAEQAKGQLTEAEGAVEDARADLDWATLTAPFDGEILDRSVEVGAVVGPGTTVFQLADTSRMKVVFAVPGRVVVGLQVGGAATVVVEGQELAGRITRLDPAADDKTRDFDVEVTVPNAGERIRAGMVAELRLPKTDAPPAAALVPIAAVVRTKGTDGYGVFVAVDEQGTTVARARPIELGGIVGNRIAVRTGLQPGEAVVVRGASIVRDGQAVRVIP